MTRSKKKPGTSTVTGRERPVPGREDAGVSRKGPRSIEGLGMEVLQWAAAELGVPISIVRKVLEADPSLIESVASAARGKDHRKPQPDAGGKPAKPKPEAVSKAQSGAPEGLLVQLEDPMNRLFVPEARPRV